MSIFFEWGEMVGAVEVGGLGSHEVFREGKFRPIGRPLKHYAVKGLDLRRAALGTLRLNPFRQIAPAR